jgi:hypothetical protein
VYFRDLWVVMLKCALSWCELSPLTSANFLVQRQASWWSIALWSLLRLWRPLLIQVLVRYPVLRRETMLFMMIKKHTKIGRPFFSCLGFTSYMWGIQYKCISKCNRRVWFRISLFYEVNSLHIWGKLHVFLSCAET